jgi:hypothetical protein
MLGFLVAWRVFALVADPLLSGLLRLVHPGETYF